LSEARKLAAILVSDVAGYSRLAGADEERSRGCARCAATSSTRSSLCTTDASSSALATARSSSSGAWWMRCYAIEVQNAGDAHKNCCYFN
jgi:hypothetical protein